MKSLFIVLILLVSGFSALPSAAQANGLRIDDNG